MNKSAQQGCKPIVLKIAIVAMSLCYVFGPLHQELNSFLHAVTHQLEMPQDILQHDNSRSSDFQKQAYTTHISDSGHDHKFLQLLDSLLKASDSEKNQEDSIRASVKTLKYIKPNIFKNHKTTILPFLAKHIFLFKKQKIKKGFQTGIIEPPQMV